MNIEQYKYKTENISIKVTLTNALGLVLSSMKLKYSAAP